MSLFVCPICGAALEREPGRYRCPAGHSYDVAREGYTHLLPANRKHSKMPGDDKGMAAARSAFLSKDYYAALRDALCRLALDYAPELENTYKKLVSMREQYEKAVEKVTATGDNEVIDFHARRMVEMAGHIILSHLLLQQASIDEEYRNSAEIYAKYGEAQNAAAATYIGCCCVDDIGLYKAVQDEH